MDAVRLDEPPRQCHPCSLFNKTSTLIRFAFHNSGHGCLPTLLRKDCVRLIALASGWLPQLINHSQVTWKPFQEVSPGRRAPRMTRSLVLANRQELALPQQQKLGMWTQSGKKTVVVHVFPDWLLVQWGSSKSSSAMSKDLKLAAFHHNNHMTASKRVEAKNYYHRADYRSISL